MLEIVVAMVQQRNTGGGGGGRGGASDNSKRKTLELVVLELVIVRYPNTITITVGAGLTSSTTTDGSDKGHNIHSWN